MQVNPRSRPFAALVLCLAVLLMGMVVGLDCDCADCTGDITCAAEPVEVPEPNPCCDSEIPESAPREAPVPCQCHIVASDDVADGVVPVLALMKNSDSHTLIIAAPEVLTDVTWVSPSHLDHPPPGHAPPIAGRALSLQLCVSRT